jgi:hypothetical protein
LITMFVNRFPVLVDVRRVLLGLSSKIMEKHLAYALVSIATR